MNSPSNAVFLILFLYPFAFFGQVPEIQPIPTAELLEIHKKYSELERVTSLRIQENPNDISSFSNRGDARLFLGKFLDSRNDYEKMIELNPKSLLDFIILFQFFICFCFFILSPNFCF